MRPRLLTHNGKTQTLLEWAIEAGISKQLLHKRLKAGWAMAEALQPPFHYGAIGERRGVDSESATL